MKQLTQNQLSMMLFLKLELVHDIKKSIERYRLLSNYFSELIQVVSQEKFETNSLENTLVLLAFKFQIQSFSFAQLLKNTKIIFKGFELDIIDESSIKTLSRALFENYLTFYYFIELPKNKKQEELYLNMYQLSSFQNQIEFEQNEKSSHFEVYKSLKSDIELLIEKIKNNPEFKNLSKNVKESLTNNDRPVQPRVKNWRDLFELALPNTLSKELWQNFSSHAHSEYISLKQIENSFKNVNQNNLINSQGYIVRQQLNLLCTYIMAFKKKFIVANKAYEVFPEEIKDQIEIWAIYFEYKK